MTVTETFFAVEVSDMDRATAFYVAALGAAVVYGTARWTSLRIAGVRVGLFHDANHAGGRVGLHFVVSNLEEARAEIERAGGGVAGPATEVAPGVVVADVRDTEGNVFSLRQA